MLLDTDSCHAAVEAKDRRFDGRFYTGVSSTGIYCRCICPARTPKRENRTYYLSAAAAEAAGFRPCLICRPELAPGLAPIDAPARLAAQAYARIEAGALEEQGLEALAAELGVTDRHLRRVMNTQFGASPIDIAQTARLLTAKRLLAETNMSVTNIAFASGFRSLRRFNAAVKQRYDMAPTQMRGRRAIPDGEAIALTLAARGALDLAPTFAFLKTRALPGVEIGEANRYARTLRIGDAVGWIEAAQTPKGLKLTVSDSLAVQLRPLIAAVRGAFDLDADIATVDAHLMQEKRLAKAIGAAPGVRVPGALDGFELAVRAVLGQQVTVAGARTLTTRLVELLGEQFPFSLAEKGLGDEGRPTAAVSEITRETRPATPKKLAAPHPPTPSPQGRGGLTHVFPTAEALASAGAVAIAKIGLPMKRAETLHRLAVASAAGKLPLMRGAVASGRAALSTIAGVGPWTIEYVALRALGDPDAYPATDIALINALGAKGEQLDHLRPWRAYAAIRLWRRAAAKGQVK